MDWTHGVLAILGALLPFASGFGVWLKMRHTHDMERRRQAMHEGAAAVGHYQEMADRLEKQNARWEASADKQQKLIDELTEKDTLCQIRLGRYWGWMAQASDRINLLTAHLRDKGHDPGYPPLESLKPPPEYDDRAGFAARTVAQDTAAVRAANPVPPPLRPDGK